MTFVASLNTFDAAEAAMKAGRATCSSHHVGLGLRVQVGPGFVGYSKWESPDLRVAAQLAMVTCGKYEASAQALLSSGMTWQNGTWSHLNSNASLGVVQHDPLPCAVVRVDSAAALSDAATVLQTAILPSVEGGYVVIRLAANVSTPVESWPHQGVLVHQNVTFIGDVNQKPEIDVHLNIDFVHIHQTTGTLTLADLIMNNMPHGPDSVYPMSMLVGAVWCVNFNRCVVGMHSFPDGLLAIPRASHTSFAANYMSQHIWLLLLRVFLPDAGRPQIAPCLL